MVKLTDSMIMDDLQNTGIFEDLPSMIIPLIVFFILMVLFFIFTGNLRQKIASGVIIILIVVIGFLSVGKNISAIRAIKDGDWVVDVDVVDRVMERESEDGDKSYYIDLDNYGKVYLDSYSDAIQHYEGEEVYIILIPDEEDDYKSAGVVYSTDEYYYVGDNEID